MSEATILVVDDNPTNLKLASDVLGYEGYRVFQAMDAAAAERIIASQPVDLVLLDIALPGMDGLMLARKLKADPATRHLILVALTAFAMVGDEQRARDAGCDGYITKPIDTRSLPVLVNGYLQKLGPGLAAGPPGLKILVIEDTPAELKLAELVLSGAGHRVRGVEKAGEALARIKEDRPDIILLDLLLHDVEGLTLARLLKADPATSAIPIVAITSFPERFPKPEALAAGCDAFLVKPLNTRELSLQIEKVAQWDRSSAPAGGSA